MVLLVLFLIIVLFVIGALVVKILLWIAIILAALWLVGFFFRRGEGRRWYRW